MRQQLTFNGRALSDFGVWFDGSVSFGSPERDVELVEVVGRDGALSISNDRFRNIEITFPCAIRSNFITNYRSLMAFLNSSKGYCRLETTQEPSHYRKALFMNQTDPTGYKLNTHGRFDLVFQVMPQRFLKSGETTASVSSSSSDVTGNLVSIDNPSGLTSLTGLSVDIEPVQSGEGDPSPTNIRPITGHTSATVQRTGKNLINNNLTTSTSRNVTAMVNADKSVYLNGTASSSGYFIMAGGFASARAELLPWMKKDGTTFIMSGGNGQQLIFYTEDGTALPTITVDDGGFTIPNNAVYFGYFIRIQNGTVYDRTIYPMIRLASVTDATYEPYQGNTYTIDLNGTRYGGTLDVLTGVLTVTWGTTTLDGSETWQGTPISGWYTTLNTLKKYKSNYVGAIYADKLATGRVQGNISGYYDNSDAYPTQNWLYYYRNTFTTANEVKSFFQTNPTQIVYELATPTTVQLTAQQVSLLTGTNIISTDMESVTVTIASPAELENPTLFESKPIIRVYGNGTLNVNDIYITVANSPYTYIDIDCELMDCYYGSNNANQYVSFSTTDYVTLRSGMNYLSYSGFTNVQVTPRWFEI